MEMEHTDSKNSYTYPNLLPIKVFQCYILDINVSCSLRIHTHMYTYMTRVTAYGFCNNNNNNNNGIFKTDDALLNFIPVFAY